MPSKSKSQQRFFGMVRKAQKDPKAMKKASPSVKKAAKSMKKKDVKDFAKTKTGKLPEKVKKEEYTVTEPTEIILGGVKYLLEAGDKIMVENEND